MIVSTFSNDKINGQVSLSGHLEYTISGTVKNGLDSIIYEAANPANFRYSYSGSGLPYPNYQIAYDETTNKGKINLVNNQFSFTIIQPNSYYIHGGQYLVKPHVHIYFPDNSSINIELGDSIPNRSLTSLHGRPPRALKR
jgi:hypothetical protein